MIRKFRPSNATMGDAFFADWCQRCQRDKAMREGAAVDDCDDTERCDIIARTMAHDVTDAEYPIEWQYDAATGEPVCTAFVEAGEQVPSPRCEHTLDLFNA